MASHYYYYGILNRNFRAVGAIAASFHPCTTPTDGASHLCPSLVRGCDNGSGGLCMCTYQQAIGIDDVVVYLHGHIRDVFVPDVDGSSSQIQDENQRSLGRS